MESNIIKEQEFIQKMTKDDDLVNYIIKNFSDEFKKKIYEICSKKVKEALNNNKNFSDIENNNEKTEDKNEEHKKNSNFTMEGGQRVQFIPNSQTMPFPFTGMPNMPNMGPMMFNQLNNNNNNQFKMYPIYIPMPQQNMQNPSPYFMVPMPFYQNMQNNTGGDNKDNIEKNK